MSDGANFCLLLLQHNLRSGVPLLFVGAFCPAPTKSKGTPDRRLTATKPHWYIECEAKTSMSLKHILLCGVKMVSAARKKCPVEKRKREGHFAT